MRIDLVDIGLVDTFFKDIDDCYTYYTDSAVWVPCQFPRER